MAGADSQKQVLTSGDFATDESQSELTLSDPRKHYSELQKELDAANADIENAKRKIEVELRVESSLTDPSIQAQKAKISSGEEELQKALDAANDDLHKAKRSKDQIEHELRNLEVQSPLEDPSIRARELAQISSGQPEISEISESKSECDQSQGRTSLQQEEKSEKFSESDLRKKKAQDRKVSMDLDVYEIYYPPSHIYLLEKAGEETLNQEKNEVPYLIAYELERTISMDSSDQSDKSTAYCTDWFAALKGEGSSTACCMDWFAGLVGEERPVVIIHGDKFKNLRKDCKLREKTFIESLKKCKPYAPEGGKSGAYFQITEDNRFIIKEIKNIEMTSFLEMALEYFLFFQQFECLAKITGVYQVWKKNYIIMENIFYGRREENLSKYDIKGIMHRFKDKAASTLLDKNFLDDMKFKSFYSSTKNNLLEKLRKDTKFLTSNSVMDYSLLVGIDEEKKELIIGIIDYLRPYTWDKRLESWTKTLLTYPAFDKPTIIPPNDYQTRFLEFIGEAINTIPDGST